MVDRGATEGRPAIWRGHAPARRRLRVRSLLMLVVLVPTAGMVAVAWASASATLDDRRSAARLQDEADGMVALVGARTAAAGEYTMTAVITVAAHIGVGIDVLSDLYGIDYRAELTAARAAVDADPILRSLPELEADLERLNEFRDEIDAGNVTYEEAEAVYLDIIATFDGVRRDRLERLDGEVASESLPGSVHARLDAVSSAFDVLTWADRRVQLTIRLLLVDNDPVQIAELIAAQGHFDAAIEHLQRVGPRVARVMAGLTSPAGRRFDATLRGAAGDLVAGEPSPLTESPRAFGDAFIEGAPWAERLTDLVQAAAMDLRDEATRQADAATRDLLTQVALAATLAALALVGALVISRSVTRPVHRLESAANQIHAGSFALEPIEVHGPRELAQTASAFNDMAFTLAAVEAHAVALADDPEAPILSHELPGRTGRALQVALNRLRSSIRRADQQRRELEEAATHDGLTGLMNRNAAFAMIEHDLSRAIRDERAMMALFIDLDGLKVINDVHGHAAGDGALVLTADALRSTTRQSDVVARIGGDEFLVAGIVRGGHDEALQLAERILDAVAAQQLVCADGPVALRCSIGVALTDADDATVDSLVRNADVALYDAKRTGRNRVAFHDHPPRRAT